MIDARSQAWFLHGLISTHSCWDTTVYHSVFKTLECGTLLNLSLLKFFEELIFHSFKLHALLLIVRDLVSHGMSFEVNLLSSVRPFHFYKLILLSHTLRFLLSDLLFLKLCMIVVFLAHTIQVMFNRVFLSTDLIHCGQFLLSEVLVSILDLLFLFFFTLLHHLSVLFSFSLSLLLFALLHQQLVIVSLL